MGATGAAGTKGYVPTVKIEKVKNPLEEVYERCYETEEYRKWSPGENLVNKFWDWAEPYKTQSIIDYGCGTGRAGLEFHRRGLKVDLCDFVENSRDPEAMDLPFHKVDLTKPLPEDFPTSHYGYCTDVLEHIPEEDVEQVVENILAHSKHCFFQISCLEDHFGNHPHIKGESREKVHLHLTVHNYSWWLQKFAEKGVVVHSSEDNNSHCIFYVTAYRGVFWDPNLGYLNTPPDKLKDNIRASAKLGLPQIRPYETQEEEVILLAGGPSLNDFKNEIRQKREEGAKLVTVNGSYNWALDKGLSPSMQVIIDAREFNKRFTKQNSLTSETKFLISSAADPESFNNLPPDRTFLFHTVLEEETWEVVKEEFGEVYKDVFPIPGGCTVTLRALAALRLLGFYKFHIYGFDSCIFETGHHAYDQPENDKDMDDAMNITVAGGSAYEKTFRCAPWMAYQALDFQAMAPRLLHDCLVEIHGDGLIAHMVRAAAAVGDGTEVVIEGTPGSVIYALRPVNEVPGLNPEQPMTALKDADLKIKA